MCENIAGPTLFQPRRDLQVRPKQETSSRAKSTKPTTIHPGTAAKECGLRPHLSRDLYAKHSNSILFLTPGPLGGTTSRPVQLPGYSLPRSTDPLSAVHRDKLGFGTANGVLFNTANQLGSSTMSWASRLISRPPLQLITTAWRIIGTRAPKGAMSQKILSSDHPACRFKQRLRYWRRKFVRKSPMFHG